MDPKPFQYGCDCRPFGKFSTLKAWTGTYSGEHPVLSCRAKPETSPTTTRRPSVAVCATLAHANVFSSLYFLLKADK
ncbi:hypothetical protein KQX54_019449 [Cotesia glomerata]|uniref:Uncharacterized protein n=1 Tax=Cotesia glomerata TaxID=32391 RepID=A0AAV7HYQ6_COTGL|nr:hypothetical protein KQX54_019449 [Cotesia glomerata]